MASLDRPGHRRADHRPGSGSSASSSGSGGPSRLRARLDRRPARRARPLATAHADRHRWQPRVHRRRAGRAAPAASVRHHYDHLTSGGRVAAGSRCGGRPSAPVISSPRRGCSWSTTTSSRCMSIRPRRGHDDRAGLARLGRLQEVRLQRARQDLRRGRGPHRSACRSTPTTTSASWLRPRRPDYADAFRQPLDRFRSDLGIPRTDVLFGDRAGRPDERRVRERYAHPRGRRVILYAPTFRGDRAAARAVQRRPRPRAGCIDALGDDHVLLLRLHPFIRCGPHADPGGARGVRDRRLRPPRHPRADARQRRPRHRLLERDLRVLPARAGRWRSSRRTSPPTSASAASTSTTASGVPGPIFETTEALAAHLREGQDDLERVARFRDESFEVADGHATERFVDRIVLPALGG